jgi:pimeloyl-ACP methyl ester carboxylesterase
MLAICVGAWLLLAPNHFPAALVVLGALALLFGHAGFLAIEFCLLALYGRDAAVPSPTWRHLARAWAVESVHAVRVFGWRQPWRSNVAADWVPRRDRTGVVLVHGFFCNRAFWNPWMARLRAGGVPHVAVDLEPSFGSIDAYGELIESAVRRVTEATGHPPVLVAHSMGGLAIRAWLARGDARRPIQRVVTLGTPHRGTWLARFSSTPNGKQMRIGSPWLDELSMLEDARKSDTRFVCYYSNCDNIVFPASLATLPGAELRYVEGVAHVQMAFVPSVMEEIVAEIEADSASSAGASALPSQG